MVDPMHVRCHHQQPQYPVDSQWYMEIAVIEHSRAVQKDFKDDHSCRRCTQDRNGRCLNAHGDDDLDGVKTNACGEIIIQIRVVHHM